MTKEQFIEECKKINVEISQETLILLDRFYKLMLEWNEKINLTRIVEEKEVYLKHFYDSLTINKVVNLNEKETLCDVGTGAGFPGLVLKIVFPNLKVTLIDSLQKRVNYLNTIIKELNLKDVEAIHSRGEDFKGQFDIVTSRAVANIEKLVSYTMHLTSRKGMFIAMKGNIEEELNVEVRKKIERKYNIQKIEMFNLPIEGSKRSLIVMNNK